MKYCDDWLQSRTPGMRFLLGMICGAIAAMLLRLLGQLVSS